MQEHLIEIPTFVGGPLSIQANQQDLPSSIKPPVMDSETAAARALRGNGSALGRAPTGDRGNSPLPPSSLPLVPDPVARHHSARCGSGCDSYAWGRRYTLDTPRWLHVRPTTPPTPLRRRCQ
jgi:hypothetical protein